MAIGKEVASYLEAHLLSIFLVFHLLRGQMGLSYFFFWCGPSQGRSQNWTRSALGQWAVAKPDLPWDNGL